MKLKHRLLAALAMLGCAAVVQAKDIVIGHVYSKTGLFEQYGLESNRGLQLGLEYATGGTMMVNGRKIVVKTRDDQSKPDVARVQLTAAYTDDNADLAVGAISSAATLAMMPIAEENKKLLIVDSSVADGITGDKWNRYVFRTARNSTIDAMTNAVLLDQPGTTIATLAQDYAFGRDGIKAFKGALKNAKIVHEEYLPPAVTDFTAGAQRIYAALKDKPGKKILFIYWAGSNNPFLVTNTIPKSANIEVVSPGATLSALGGLKEFEGMQGTTYYYYGIPKNPINNWLVTEYYKKYKNPPDFFTVCGMAAGLAIVEALKKTKADTDTEKLISVLAGMTFDTPKGKMTIRKEDHQAVQSMYHYKLKNDPAFAWAVPTLVREIKPEEIDLPVRNKK